MYLLDTNICIEFLRGNLQYAYDHLMEEPSEIFGVPAIAEAELFMGVEKASPRWKALNRVKVESLVRAFQIVPFDEDCARAYAHIRAYLESKGKKIGPNDMLIAATALAHQAVLVTNNFREFERVPGLQIESWYDIPF